MRYSRITIIALILTALGALTLVRGAEKVDLKTPAPAEFGAYWFQGRAEISRFSLEQARYGEIHKGDAVFIFVTETMNPTLQVKADNPEAGDVPVLKLNATRKFNTGIYPYSVMISTFSPLDFRKYPVPLKMTTTVQEWCGHVFVQMNLRDNQYKVQSRSYFEKESDKDFSITPVLSEDGLWNLIRLAPDTLPQGEFTLLPGAVHTRFLHRPITPRKALGSLKASREKSLEGNDLLSYKIIFPKDKRALTIHFEQKFPHRVQGWEDTRKTPDGRELVTRAKRTHTIMSDYWRKNKNTDRKLRNKLGL